MELENGSSDDSIVLNTNQSPRNSWVMLHSHRLGPLIILIVSMLFLFASLPLTLGSLSRPGPGLWPLFIASLTAVLAILTGFHARKNEEYFDRKGLLRVGYLLVALVAFPYLFDVIGFAAPSILLIVFMMRFLSKEPWVKSIAVAVITTGITYVLFGVLLNVRLPAITFG